MCRASQVVIQSKTDRRWHREINVNQCRLPLVSALASDILALVQSDGHIIDDVSEFTLLSSDDIQKLQKTKQTVLLL
uniref:Uncharacterized protein n=1 Tax=Glossina palpalis gambiensis TaxID=67801 RepID=A0A1B0C4Q2_9MUSC